MPLDWQYYFYLFNPLKISVCLEMKPNNLEVLQKPKQTNIYIYKYIYA